LGGCLGWWETPNCSDWKVPAVRSLDAIWLFRQTSSNRIIALKSQTTANPLSAAAADDSSLVVWMEKARPLSILEMDTFTDLCGSSTIRWMLYGSFVRHPNDLFIP